MAHNPAAALLDATALRLSFSRPREGVKNSLRDSHAGSSKLSTSGQHQQGSKSALRLSVGDVRHRRRPRLSEKDRLLVLALRFGSLERFEQPVASVTEVARLLNLQPKSVSRLLIRLRARGYDTRIRSSPGRPRQAIPEHVVNHVTSHRTLQEWSSLALRDRCVMIERLFGVEVSVGRLRRLYQAAHLRYRRPEVHSIREAEIGQPLVDARC